MALEVEWRTARIRGGLIRGMLPLTQHKMREADVWRIDGRNLQGCFSACPLEPASLHCLVWLSSGRSYSHPSTALTPVPPLPEPAVLGPREHQAPHHTPVRRACCRHSWPAAGLLHAWAEPCPCARWPSTGHLQRHPFPSLHSSTARSTVHLGCLRSNTHPAHTAAQCRFGFSAADVQHGFETAHLADKTGAIKVMFNLPE